MIHLVSFVKSEKILWGFFGLTLRELVYYNVNGSYIPLARNYFWFTSISRVVIRFSHRISFILESKVLP
jgi:hypothetical protein